ncbi:conserved exported hypothetical protein [Magnetospirillum sp. LM-5]|uniref:c-type cytochrome n=1 Tax=Magnetospirillum sp. LM-5 TaxID=2681466 RepID=UPI001382E0DB|nr:cytochrome c [Magnetospirillum sp. LM-5]CAA7612612.1 conserved exported hypothetical protein [Magnetospirillum sp. LM-5]
MKKVVLMLLAGLAAPPAWAQSHGAMLPFYGGQIGLSGDLHVEFVVRDGLIRAWVRDHADKPVAAVGKATVLVGAARHEVSFTEDGAGLKAELPVKAADKVTAVLSLTAQGRPLSARFAQAELVQPSLTGAALAGKAVFERVCATCHGTALRGSDQGPPLIHAWYAPGGGHDDSQVLKVLREGTKGHMWKLGDMPKPEGLKAGEDKPALAYVRAMQAANGIDQSAPLPGMGGHSGHSGH